MARYYVCDLCGERLGTATANGFYSKKGLEIGAFNNVLQIKSWIDIPQQKTRIECGYDLCDDCAKAISRKLMNISNNRTWANKEHKREWL